MRHPDGTALYYRYNEAGYPTTTTDSKAANAPAIRTIEGMDHNGLLTQVGYRNGLTTTIGYTQGGETTSICTTLRNGNCLATSTNQVQFLEYDQYDSFGNLLRRKNHTQDIEEIFTYDSQDRVTSATNRSTLHPEIATFYSYDASGNMTAKSDYSVNTANAYTYGTADAQARQSSADKAGPNAAKSVV